MDVGAREKHEVLGAAQHVFELLARDQPLMAVVDNAQWAGPMFLDLIEHIAERSRDAPILICCLARPELLAEHPRFARRPPGRLIRLAALPEDQVGLLVRHLVGGDLEDETQRRIAESADGNPFFAAELVRMLRERGELVQRDGCWTLSAPTRPLQFPPTVTAIIEARLDRLPAHDRTVLERAAIVGTAFTAGAVAAIAPVELRNSVGESLDELLRTELIRTAKTTSREGTFRFAHALIRDTAYAGIPKQARAELHDQLGRWLQERSQTEELDVIAYHLEQAAQLRRELERPGSTDVPSLPEG
jgi:predicted ATPase